MWEAIFLSFFRRYIIYNLFSKRALQLFSTNVFSKSCIKTSPNSFFNWKPRFEIENLGFVRSYVSSFSKVILHIIYYLEEFFNFIPRNFSPKVISKQTYNAFWVRNVGINATTGQGHQLLMFLPCLNLD